MFVFSSKYLPTAVFVEGIDKLFDSFNSVKHDAPGKVWHSPLSDNSPHIGHWTKASMGIFIDDDKPVFKKPTQSHNGWITDIGPVQLVWRLLKNDVLTILRLKLKTKLRGFSPRANHTDRAAAAGRRS